MKSNTKCVKKKKKKKIGQNIMVYSHTNKFIVFFRQRFWFVYVILKTNNICFCRMRLFYHFVVLYTLLIVFVVCFLPLNRHSDAYNTHTKYIDDTWSCRTFLVKKFYFYYSKSYYFMWQATHVLFKNHYYNIYFFFTQFLFPSRSFGCHFLSNLILYVF